MGLSEPDALGCLERFRGDKILKLSRDNIPKTLLSSKPIQTTQSGLIYDRDKILQKCGKGSSLKTDP